MDIHSTEPHLDDTISITAVKDTCSSADADLTVDDLSVSTVPQCFQNESIPMSVNEYYQSHCIWDLKSVQSDGIEALLISDTYSKYQISIFDVLGREVYNSEFAVGIGETPIKMKFAVKPTVYLIRVSDGVTTETKKIINLHIR